MNWCAFSTLARTHHRKHAQNGPLSRLAYTDDSRQTGYHVLKDTYAARRHTAVSEPSGASTFHLAAPASVAAHHTPCFEIHRLLHSISGACTRAHLLDCRSFGGTFMGALRAWPLTTDATVDADLEPMEPTQLALPNERRRLLCGRANLGQNGSEATTHILPCTRAVIA